MYYDFVRKPREVFLQVGAGDRDKMKGEVRKMRETPLFVQKCAPRTAIMHQQASGCIECSQFQDACWLRAEWTRSPSGENSI